MKRGLKGFILLLITLVFLYFVFVNINFTELIREFRYFDYRYILILIISTIVSLSFRALCFKQLVSKALPEARLKELIPLCLTGAGLNIVLPARAGDIFRAYYAGAKYKVDKMKIFGSVILERLFDIVIIFCLLFFAVMVYHRNSLAVKLCIFAAGVLVLGIVFAVLTYKYNNIDKVCGFINNKTVNLPFHNLIEKSTEFVNKICSSFFRGFEIINSPKKVLYALTASLGIWVFECINYLIVIQGFGLDVHWSVSLFVIGFIALACMIPSTSIFIGPYQVAVIAAFAIYDISKESALAISFLEQSIVTIFLSAVVFIFLITNNISYSQLKRDISEELE